MMSTIHDILFDYQTEDVDRLVNDIPRGIIGSEMGTGKTEVFLAAADKMGAERVLIVVPKTMVLEWRDRIQLRFKEDAAVPYGAEEGKYFRMALDMEHFNHRFLVINHEMLRMERYMNLLKLVPWDLIGFDEAHRFKNRKAKQTQGAMELARLSADRKDRILFISGTPFENYPDELWTLLHMIDRRRFPVYWNFVREYCYTYSTDRKSVV